MTPSPTWVQLGSLRRLVRDAFADYLDSPAVTIAGGAVRDTLLGRPVKDVDCYVHLPKDTALPLGWLEDIVEGITSSLHNGYVTKRAKSPIGAAPKAEPGPIGIVRSFDAEDKSYSSEGENVMSALFDVPGFLPLQVILQPKPVDGPTLVSNFDFTICQAWLDSKDRPQVTSAFRRDSQERILRHTGRGVRGKAGADHARRLLAKFPGWKMHGYSFPLEPAAGVVFVAEPVPAAHLPVSAKPSWAALEQQAFAACPAPFAR